MPTLTLSHWLSLHGLFTVATLLIYVVTSHVLQQRRHPSAAIGWVLFILLLPYAALPLYLLLGTRKFIHASRSSPDMGRMIKEECGWAVQTAAALAQPHPVMYRDLFVHGDGAEALAALLTAIDGARYSLDLCTFMLGRDEVGAAVQARLAARVRAGVRVRLLLDGVGRMLGGHPDLSALKQSGVQVGIFVPPLHSPLKGRTNLRNHRKLVVADAGYPTERLWCGGRNLAAEYFEGRPGRPAWRDLTFDLQGPLDRAEPMDDGAESSIPIGASTAQIIASGPDQADDTVHALLVTAAYRARSRIVLVSPYVVLDDALLIGLTLAARRGVQVDLLMPERSNHRLADIARHRSLRALAEAGTRVWLTPTMLHAKAAIIDDALALVGSTNFDSRSLFLNYELMVAFHDQASVAQYIAWFDRERSMACPYVSQPPGLWRDLGEGLVLWLGFQL
jgi:cardiolipin synthase